MKNKIFIIIGIVTVLIVLIFIFGKTYSNNYVKIDNKKTNVEVADTSEEKREGLMFRENLCENCGMLFVYGEEKIPTYWMKNTKIPLDIVFINSNLEVVDLFHAEPCYQEPCKTYAPKNKSLYVLETNINRFNESIIGKKVSININ